MSKQEAISYIDQAKEIPTIQWISFTGGEPLMYPKLLEYLVKYASDKNFLTEVVTNCFWAETEKKAEDTLVKLVRAGLDVINISVDDFHQQHIPFEFVHNCYKVAMGFGMKVVIMCAVQKSSNLRVSDIKQRLGNETIQILTQGQIRPSTQVVIVETGFIPVGRGVKIPKDEWLIGEKNISGPCNLVLRDIGISPLGIVLPCCSATSLLESVRLGNAKEDNLTRILERASLNPIFNNISTEGPSVMAERIGLKNIQCVNRCHLCYEILSK
jgi:MoaA/NifB/PqqE/SkfB family radical SAM enzyme